MYDEYRVIEDVKLILNHCLNVPRDMCDKVQNCSECRVKRLLNYVDNLDREESFYERRFNNVQ